MASTVNPIDIQPRAVANKSDKHALLEALRMTLNIQSAAIRHNTQTSIATAMLPLPSFPTMTR